AGLAHHSQVWVQLQQRLQALAQETLVVHQQDGDAGLVRRGAQGTLTLASECASGRRRSAPAAGEGSWTTGKLTARRLPPSAPEPKPSWPPSSSTRSRSPVRPKPLSPRPETGPTPSSSTASSTCPSWRARTTRAERARAWR